MEVLSNFHFLRPWWLIALPCWFLLSFMLWRLRHGNNGWSALCDPALLGFLLGESNLNNRSRLALTGLMIAGISSVMALTGPVWKQLPQPVYQVQSAMIIILDLSRSMLAEDMRPNRLIRARQKLQDILKLRQEGQTGLIVFAGSAFDVAPLTTDNKAILNLLQVLEPSMMPVQGSMASAALSRAMAMFKRGVIHHGSVVLLTDGVDTDANAVAEKLAQAGHQISVLGVGTEAGAPIPSQDGGFLKDDSGNIVVPGLETAALQTLANAGEGIYQPIRVDDLDVKSLPGLLSVQGEKVEKEDFHSDQWREEGPWLVLLLLLPLLALVFRRGVLLVVFLLPLLSPDLSYAFEWKDVWQTPDQQAEILLQQKKSGQAAAKFEDPGWKASALYRAEKYKESAKILETLKSADAHYNRGNALAKSGDLKAAAEAYEQALKTDKNHKDAEFNLDLVKKAMQQQQSKDQDKSDKSDKSDQQSGEKKQGDQSDKSEQQSSEDEKDQSGKQSGQNEKENEQSSESQQSEQQEQKEEEQSQSEQEKQAKDDAEQEKERQQQAMQSAESTEQKKSEEEMKASAMEKEADREQTEEEKARQQWLRRIPDDPGGLLRRKFRYQYKQRGQQQTGKEGQAW